MPPKKTSQTHSFEHSLSELETIVKTLEQGQLPLENALDHFERGIQLAKQCQQTLSQAEQKVAKLVSKTEGEWITAPFQQDEADDE